MVRPYILCILVTLLYVASSSAQSPRKGRVSAQAPPAVSNIRQFDLKNFTYRVKHADGQAMAVRLSNGSHVERERNGTITFSTGVSHLAYGDLTGDGRDEAVVVLTSSEGGSGYGSQGFIYTLQSGHPSLLTEFDGGAREDATLGARIENGLLIVDRGEFLEGDAPCCPVHYRSHSYRWDGSRLIEVGRSYIKTKTEPDSVPAVSVTPRDSAHNADGNWERFFANFRTAVQKRDRVALLQMMAPDFTYSCCDNPDTNGNDETRDEALRNWDNPKIRGWDRLSKAIAQGTAPEAAWRAPRGGTATRRIAPPSANRKDFYGWDPIKKEYKGWAAVFELRNNRWYFVSFEEPGE